MSESENVFHRSTRDLTLGLVLIALALNGSLLGFATAQFVNYVRQYWKRDRLFLRALVGAVLALEIFHFTLYSASMYDILVGRRFAVGFSQLPWMSTAQILVNSTIIATVQSFYLHRIWSLSENISLLIFLGALVAASWCVGVALMVTAIPPTVPTTIIALKNISTAMNAVTATSDIAITVSLSILLLRSQIVGTRSQQLVKRLTIYSINTGALTSLCAFLSLVTIMLMGDTDFYVLFYYIGTRLYTNSMIASLNARQGLRDDMDAAPGITTFSHIDTHHDPDADATLSNAPPKSKKQHSSQSLRALFGAHRSSRPPSAQKGKGVAFDHFEDGADGPPEHYHPARVPTQ